MTALRSTLFLIGAVVVTLFFGVLVPACGLFSYRAALCTARAWARRLVEWAQVSCGIRYEIHGWENVPAGPAVIMAKHQSAWETLFIEATFPYQCWIIKRELLWLPFVGWGLAGVRSIAIDRKSGMNARDQIVEQGAERIKDGLWVTIFPEGTRVAVGKRGRYAFRKTAGTVQVMIGPVIETAGRDALSVNREVEEWIEGKMRSLSPERYAGT